MFCKKCGAQMPNGQAFCSNCGAPLSPAAEPQPAPAREERFENWTTPVEKPKKKKKALAWILGIVGVLLVAAIVVGFLTGFFQNQYQKIFNKDEYLEKIERKNLEKVLDPDETAKSSAAGDVFATSLRGAMDTDPEESRRITLQLNFNQNALSKDALETLQDALANEFGPGADMDFSWFKNIAIAVEMDKDLENNQFGGVIIAMVNGKDIITADFAVDFENGKIFFRVPDLSSKYVEIDLNEMGYDVSEAAMYREYAEQAFEALSEVDEEKLNKVILRYADIILNDLGEGTVESQELSAGGVSGTYTATSVTIDGKKVLKITKDVLNELLDDGDVEDIFYDFTDEVEFISASDADSAYDAFIDEINNTLDELENADPSDVPFSIPMTVYTDAAGNIIGRSFKIRDEDKTVMAEFNAYTVGSGLTKFGTKAELKLFAESYAVGYNDLTVSFEGSGEKNLKKELSGSFDLSFKLVDPDTKDTLSLKLLKIGLQAKADTDYVDYKINLAPTDDLIQAVKAMAYGGSFYTNDEMEEYAETFDSNIPEEAEPFVKMIKDLSIELRGVISKDERSAAIAVMVKSKDLVSVVLESRVIDSADIVIPKSAVAPYEWSSSLESDKLLSVAGDVLSKLKDAGVPSSLIEMIRSNIM